jgi:hypothetical protein
MPAPGSSCTCRAAPSRSILAQLGSS